MTMVHALPSFGDTTETHQKVSEYIIFLNSNDFVTRNSCIRTAKPFNASQFS